MIYTERKNLAVIELQEEQTSFSYEELFQILMNCPSPVIYVELKGFLYGIITLGRIKRAYQNQLKQVEINTKFTAIGPGSSMKAREIFKQERINMERRKQIHVLPVVTSDRKLIGHYYADEDILFFAEYMFPLLKRLNVDLVQCGYRLTLVRPCRDDEKKYRQFVEFKKILESKGLQIVEIIDFLQVLDYSNSVDYILFWDERQLCTAEILHNCLQKNKKHQVHFVSIQNFMYNILMNTTNGILDAVQEQGIHVLTVDFEENESGYLEKFKTEIDNSRRKNNGTFSIKLLPDMRREFLLDLYEQFDGWDIPHSISGHMYDGVFQPHDMSVPFFHVEHGLRRTIGQPEKYKRCIHIFGTCFVLGIYTDDKHTIPSLLQKRINHAGLECKVENWGIVSGWNGTISNLSRLVTAPLMTGDVVIFVNSDLKLLKIQNLNLTNTLEQQQLPVTWFVDGPPHCNHKANQAFADAIYENLLPVLQQPAENRHPIEKDRDPVRQLYLNKYFADFDVSAYKTVGSVVMNCNPFTFGHRYLVEEALKQVDFLIIFVVEEDLSLFSFEERFSMVCAGTADLKHVMVVPSGRFILSRMTFPEYFIKETDDEIVENTENDIKLFAEKIAPRLGITHRFVGEELEDQVTDTYNQAMKRILPAYNIQLVEVQRKQNRKSVISASRVRKCLEDNDLEALNALVPDSTKKILFYVNE